MIRSLKRLDSNVSENLLCRGASWYCEEISCSHNGWNLFLILLPIHKKKIQCSLPFATLWERPQIMAEITVNK